MKLIRYSFLSLFYAVALFILLPLSLIFICLGAFALTSPHPSDTELIANYERYQADFEWLAQAFQTEEEIRVIYPETKSCQTTTQEQVFATNHERCQVYVALFQKLDFDWAYVNQEAIYFIVSTSGLGVSGSSKGYLYITNPPNKVVHDTNVWDGSTEYRIKHISGSWYIFYDRR